MNNRCSRSILGLGPVLTSSLWWADSSLSFLFFYLLLLSFITLILFESNISFRLKHTLYFLESSRKQPSSWCKYLFRYFPKYILLSLRLLHERWCNRKASFTSGQQQLGLDGMLNRHVIKVVIKVDFIAKYYYHISLCNKRTIIVKCYNKYIAEIVVRRAICYTGSYTCVPIIWNFKGEGK